MCEGCSNSNEQMEPTENKLFGPNDGHVGSCIDRTASPEQGTRRQDGLNPSEGSLSSPTVLVTGNDSSVSDSSDYSVDCSPLDGRKEGLSESTNQDAMHEQTSKSSPSVDALKQSSDLKEIHGEDKNNPRLENLKNPNDRDGNVDDGGGKNEPADEENERAPTFDVKDEFWDPPEPENEEDDQETTSVGSTIVSVADSDDEGDGMAVADFNDDKDGSANSDGKDLAKPSWSGNSESEASRSRRFEEEKQKAMVEVMNGKFKNLVCQLLKKADVDDKNEGWVDIVTRLAWEAASFVRPDAAEREGMDHPDATERSSDSEGTEGKAMDPAGYVKVKCIATGTRSESQLIKGLVFKKHAAVKNMITEYKRPRILLIKGMLQSSASSGLASFHSMVKPTKEPHSLGQDDGDENEDADLLNSLIALHPDVILVEKSASRKLLNKLRDSKITVVVDMKLHRLKRVARCIDSPILSSGSKFDQKLKRCEYLHFEKFVEEHAGEGEKRPSKTLMFLEGCPTCQGCTILLKGSHSEELKKIKYIVQCAVVMAYHFILETSFLVHQKLMFSTIAFDGPFDISETSGIPGQPNISYASENGVHNNEGSSQVQESAIETATSSASDTPISNSLHEEKSAVVEGPTTEPASYGPHTTINEALVNVSITSPSTYEQFMGSIGGENKDPSTPTHTASSVEELANQDGKEPKIDDNHHHQPLSISLAAGDARQIDDDGEDYVQPKDEISSVLDSESILVLVSRRNTSRGTICEQSHLSHIKFYRNFDVPLGKFLRENLFNQSARCEACNELPEGHYYYYAHHNKQLTIQVRRLSPEKKLPGESEGKLWMWSRCGKCGPDKEKATKRVLISTAASGLSFGKFLELSFSNQSSFNRLSTCGHSLQKDFLYFFGLSSMVAMFRYSRVATYTVSVPPQKLEFNCSVSGDWLQQEIEGVYTKGLSLFSEIEKHLKKLESRFSGSDLVLGDSLKAFDDIADMLSLERSEFGRKIKDFRIQNDESQNSVRILLKLNELRWEILLEAFVWARRLQLLLHSSSNIPHGTSTHGAVQKQTELKEDVNDERESKEGSHTSSEKGEMAVEEPVSRGQDGGEKQEAEEKGKPDDKIAQGQTNEEQIPAEVRPSGVADSGHQNVVIESKDVSEKRADIDDVQTETITGEHKPSVGDLPSGETLQEGEKQDPGRLADSELDIDQGSISGDSVHSVLVSHEPESSNLPSPVPPKPNDVPDSGHGKKNSSVEGPVEWVWNPFEKIREECIKDLQKGRTTKFGHLTKFEEALLNTREISPTISEMIIEEGSRVHVPFYGGEYVVSDYDGEISSSVACALASWNELNPAENVGPLRANSMPLDFPVPDSSGRDMIISAPSLPAPESLAAQGPMHPEVNVGAEKYPPRGKYSVVILYAEKFRDLRKDCCPSELDYIASLSRCKIWDAKGGKSKSLFSKTLDGRLIIKEIKKTEYESFMKFANQYFEYLQQSFKLGNQTCLAKILGIYQVTVRHPKSGKETKHDVMVQENLSFGRNITRQYDLKGALHARFTATADGTDDVLLDQNFVNDMNSSPLYVGQKAKRLLQRAVWNDTTFLTSINVMDYSLLVGVDRGRKELVCGIIDYLRQYTWDKQLETWVKISLVTPKNMLPTIISPREYKKRFRKFMDTHFLTVPDNWCSQRSSNPCKLCGIRSGDSSPVKSDKQPEQQLNGFH